MARILDILKEFLNEIEKDNPFNLVVKGGTALSLYYLNHHRESEDLDFDAPKNLIKKYKKIEDYFINILENLKQKQIISEYKINKSGFASTNRYHIKVELETYKTFHTKIDLDFVELPKNMLKKGQLNLYTIERMFITKALTFINRKEFKDIYDIACLIDKIDESSFTKKEKVISLLQNTIEVLKEEDVKRLYKTAFRNVDLKFKNLKESELESFIQKTIKKLNILINKLKRY